MLLFQNLFSIVECGLRLLSKSTINPIIAMNASAAAIISKYCKGVKVPATSVFVGAVAELRLKVLTVVPSESVNAL